MNPHRQRPILCEIDLSEVVAHAANVAVASAARLQEPLLILGVDKRGETTASCRPSIMDTMRSQLGEVAVRVREVGASAEGMIMAGMPVDSGAHRPVHNLAATLGSTAHAVIARSTRPVLVVPQPPS